MMICGACRREYKGGTTYSYNIYKDTPYICFKCRDKKSVIQHVANAEFKNERKSLTYKLTKAQSFAIELHHTFCKGNYGYNCDWYYKVGTKSAWRYNCHRTYLKMAKQLLKLNPGFKMKDLRIIHRVLDGEY